MSGLSELVRGQMNSYKFQSQDVRLDPDRRMISDNREVNWAIGVGMSKKSESSSPPYYLTHGLKALDYPLSGGWEALIVESDKH